MHHNCSAEYRYIQRNVYVGNIYLLKKCPLLNNCPLCPFILPASLPTVDDCCHRSLANLQLEALTSLDS